LDDQLTHDRYQIDRHLHCRMGGGLERGIILGGRFLVRLRLVVFQNAADALRIPAIEIGGLLHDFQYRRGDTDLDQAGAPEGEHFVGRAGEVQRGDVDVGVSDDPRHATGRGGTP
jgi:hypothetical protein